MTVTLAQLSPATVARLDELQSRYISALDDRRLNDWVDCFSERDDASYICRSGENEANGWPIALMMDDCRGRLKDRVMFITQIWRGTYQDYVMRHFTQRLSCEHQDDGSYRLRTNFSIEYTPDGESARTLTAGVYEDVVIEEGGEFRFLSKRAVYDAAVLPRYIVYPF